MISHKQEQRKELILTVSQETYEAVERLAEALGVPIEELADQLLARGMREKTRRNPRLARLLLKGSPLRNEVLVGKDKSAQSD